MGIERFFSAINKNYDVVDVMSNIKKLKTDIFFLDFNSIIHVVSAKYITELNIRNKLNNNEKYDENSIILQVKKYLDNLLENVECNLVYIANDRQKSFKFIGKKFTENKIVTIANYSGFAINDNGLIEIQLGRRNFELIINKKSLKVNGLKLNPLIHSLVIN